MAQDPEPKIEPVRSQITVLEKVTTEAPASITVLGALALKQIPGVNLDDRLRMVPGFSLFRRSSSLAANPTTQGVSLRAIGSSGASRTLVLWDGVPLNDPFGGWVYWTRVAPESVGQVEVSRGAATSVFGDRALGGSIALFSKPIDGEHYFGAIDAGNTAQLSPSAGYQNRLGRYGFGGQARAFRTDGYFIVPRTIRGRADAKADVDFAAGDLRFDVAADKQRFGLKLDILAEERGNGTAFQRNSTSMGALSATYARTWTQDTLSAAVFHQRQQYHQSFSTIAADRNSERLTSNQSVPAEAVGGSGVYRHQSAAWNVTAGGDFNRVNGTSLDYLIPAGQRIGGGTVFQRGAFGQADFKVKDLRLFAGARQQFTGLRNGSQFFSPSAGLTYGRGFWRLRGSTYRAFRAPTLNELFREFRAGNAITQANPALAPEKLFGAEAGVDLTGEQTRLSVTFFRNDLDGLVTNVTLSSTPAQIIRQRRNAAGALNRGVEIDLRHNWRHWRVETGYLFASSRFATGERVPQIPMHQGTAQLTFTRGRTLITGGLRSSTLQFEDDRNVFRLPGFAVVQAVARQQITAHLSANLVFENLLDREVLTGFTPAPQIGAPRLWRAGIRWEK